MTIKEEILRRIAVMQAWCDGERIELLDEDNVWKQIEAPEWLWARMNYRIAPKPKRKVKFLAYMDMSGWLKHVSNGAYYTQTHGWKRIPSLDLEAEVDD